MFSEELIERAKRLFPTWNEIHKAMSEGTPKVLAMLQEIDMSLDPSEVRGYAEAGDIERILEACDRADARRQLLKDCRMAYHDRLLSKA